MTKYLIGGVLILLILVFLGSRLLTKPSQRASNETQNLPPNTVVLTQDGFSPSALTIKAGDKVTWINKSGSDATVNSDPHPIHTDYPPLNLGNFPSSQTLSLTFDKPGTYGYHDHLDPNLHGTIIVK